MLCARSDSDEASTKTGKARLVNRLPLILPSLISGEVGLESEAEGQGTALAATRICRWAKSLLNLTTRRRH